MVFSEIDRYFNDQLAYYYFYLSDYTIQPCYQLNLSPILHMPHPESIPKASRRKKYHYTYYFSDLWSGREIASELKSHTGILVFKKIRPHDHRPVHRIIGQHVRWWSKLFISTTLRPPPKFVEFYISAQYAYCQISPNLWQKYCPTLGNGIGQRLAKMFSNVWQKCFQTFDKGLFNVW